MIQTAREARVPLSAAERHLLTWHPKLIAEHTPAIMKLPKPVREVMTTRLEDPDQLEALEPEPFRLFSAIEFADRLARGALAGEGLDRVIEPIHAWATALSMKSDRIDTAIRNSITQFATDRIRLQLHCNAPCEMQTGQKHHRRLASPVHALYVSQDSQTDAHRLFFESLSTPVPNEKPNLVVVQVPNASTRDALIEQVLKLEADNGLAPLPLLALSTNGSHRLEEERLGQRPISHAPAVFHADTMIDWINEML